MLLEARFGSPDPQTFQPDLHFAFAACHEIHQAAVSPLEHAQPRLEVVAHADLYLDTAFGDQAFICLGYVVPDILEAFLPWIQRPSHTPDDDSRSQVDLLHDTAVRDGAAARHSQWAANQNV